MSAPATESEESVNRSMVDDIRLSIRERLSDLTGNAMMSASYTTMARAATAKSPKPEGWPLTRKASGQKVIQSYRVSLLNDLAGGCCSSFLYMLV